MSYTIEKLDLDHLSSKEQEQFALFIPPKYRCCLQGIDPDNIDYAKLIAIGLKYEGEPVGVAVASDYEGLRFVQVFSIYIEESHQNIALASEMLHKIEQEALPSRAVVITIFLRKTDLDSPFIESLLQYCHWSEPKLHMLRYFFDCFTFGPEWHLNPPELSSEYEIFPWNSLKNNEREEIEKNYNQGHFSSDVYPFGDETWIESTNSLGLRFKGELIGWCVTERIAPDTIRYSALYVKRDYKFKGCAIRLLIDSITLQQKSTIKWSVFELVPAEASRSWFRFVQNRLAPYAIETDILYKSWKAIG